MLQNIALSFQGLWSHKLRSFLTMLGIIIGCLAVIMLVSIAQSAPGLVAANASIIMGYRMGGFRGTAVALLATALPPLITLTIISFFYETFASNTYVRMFLKGMQCGVTAILVNVVLDLVLKQWKKKLALPLLIMAGSFIASYIFKINIMQIFTFSA